MKPLIRWIVGPVHPRGFEILRYSIIMFKKLYQDRFDLMVCYNQIQDPNIPYVESFDQSSIQPDLSVIDDDSWKGTGWKLCPPRLRLNSHEIIVDNDVVFYEKVDLVEEFLQSSFLLGFSAKHQAYGGLDRHQPTRFDIDPNLFLNSGLIGLPPGFDFGAELAKVYDGKPVIRHDEQGLVAAVFSKHRHKLIGFDDMSPLDDKTHNKSCKIAHFIHANTNNERHLAWEEANEQTLI